MSFSRYGLTFSVRNIAIYVNQKMGQLRHQYHVKILTQKDARCKNFFATMNRLLSKKIWKKSVQKHAMYVNKEVNQPDPKDKPQ